MNVGTQMRNIRDAFKTVNQFPQLKNIPLVIGESDPEGCAACGMNTNPENAYRNGTMYSSYTAASFARKYLLADEHNVNLIGAVSWSFEFENQPWFAGFRDLATNCVDKPVLNVFRMFGMMKGKRVAVTGNRMYDLKTFVDSSVRRQNDIGGIAAKDGNSATVMIWNYHDEDNHGSDELVQIELEGLPSKGQIMEYRIDAQHANSYELWKKMGSPQNPTAEQVNQLEKEGQLQPLEKPKKFKAKGGKMSIKIHIAPQAVSFFKLNW